MNFAKFPRVYGFGILLVQKNGCSDWDALIAAAHFFLGGDSLKRNKMIRKWGSVFLAGTLLLSLCLLVLRLHPDDRLDPLPQRTLQLSPETGSSSDDTPSSQPTEQTQTEPSELEESLPNDNSLTNSESIPTENGNSSPDSPTSPNPNGKEDPSAPEETELRIVTDLTDRVLTFSELTEDVFPFYAYLAGGEADMYLRVKLRNRQTPANGQFLTANGRNYQATLARQETNFITLYVKQANKTILEATYTIRYVAQQANENTPTIGPHPPSISTNLDGYSDEITNRNFTFLVTARTNTGATIYSDHILITLDGNAVRAPTGSGTYEYELYFRDPVVGDTETHVVTVLAWDDAGNSAFVRYEVTYAFIDHGSENGTAYLLLDATVVGLDPDTMGGTYTYKIKQDEPASYAVLAMLKDFGYEVDSPRDADDGFYLRSISRPGLLDYAEIPDNLMQKILQDGLTLTGQPNSDTLGEFAYTQGSGWMYSVNGTLYAGKGLSNYYLNDGDTLYLRFTLAYGKDIGGYVDSSGSYGKLKTYCGRWINGTYLDEHQWGEETILRAATCTESGCMVKTCSVCGDVQTTAEIPALGHDYVETARKEPTQEEAGWIQYICSRCQDSKQEQLPKLDPTIEPNRRKRNEKTIFGMDSICLSMLLRRCPRCSG